VGIGGRLLSLVEAVFAYKTAWKAQVSVFPTQAFLVLELPIKGVKGWKAILAYFWYSLGPLAKGLASPF